MPENAKGKNRRTTCFFPIRSERETSSNFPSILRCKLNSGALVFVGNAIDGKLYIRNAGLSTRTMNILLLK
jgi:hypothetical protein